MRRQHRNRIKAMVEREFKRKLTAVFSADVAGYSRLMGDNEASTVTTLEAYKEVIYALIRQHRGRLIDSTGDNLLAEFVSVVNAVQCAVAVQKELQSRNEGLPEERRMRFRIGINLGDVIEEEGRIYGDGVNIAARLESLADPGGICISRTAFDQIETKLPFGYEYLGEQEVKNIARLVPAYRVLMEPRVEGPVPEKKAMHGVRLRRYRVLGSALAVLLLIGLAVWMVYRGLPGPVPPSGDRGVSSRSEEKSLAVLPFDNLSGDPGQDYLSDGITEDLITALSAVPRLIVISRNSTFAYKGKSVDVRQIGQELGVGYVLEGSIQIEETKVRITAQLIDAADGRHVWAERYDRDLKEIFSLQDEIILHIVRSLQLTLGEGDRHAMVREAPKNLDAYLKLLKGKAHFMNRSRPENEKARRLFEEAIALIPDYPAGYKLLARTYLREVWLGWSKDSGDAIQQALSRAEKSLALDPSDGGVHALLSQTYLLQGKYEKAVAEGEEALSLSPNLVDGYLSLGMSLYFSGRYQEAVKSYTAAMRLDPTPPAGLLYHFGNAYLMMGKYKEAEAAYSRALARNPKNVWPHVGMAALYSMSGDQKKAKEEASKVLEANPSFSLENLHEIFLHRNPEDKERLMNALRQAGLI